VSQHAESRVVWCSSIKRSRRQGAAAAAAATAAAACGVAARAADYKTEDGGKNMKVKGI
jgi:hypothetical protein